MLLISYCLGVSSKFLQLDTGCTQVHSLLFLVKVRSKYSFLVMHHWSYEEQIVLFDIQVT